MGERERSHRELFDAIKAEARQERIKNQLKKFQEQHAVGDPFAVYSALLECEDEAEPLPSWLTKEVKRSLRNWMTDELPSKSDGPKRRTYVDRTRWLWCRLVIGVQQKYNGNENDGPLIDPARAFGCITGLPAQITDLFARDKNYELGKYKERAYEIVSDALKGTSGAGTKEAVKASYLKIEKRRDRKGDGLPPEHWGRWAISDRVLRDHGIEPIPYDPISPYELPANLLALYLRDMPEYEREQYLEHYPADCQTKVHKILGD